MSIRGDIATSVRERVEEKVEALNRVLVIGAVLEFGELGLNPPSAGVIMTRSVNSNTDTPPGEVYVYFTVQIWVAASRFGATDQESGLSNETGLYNLLDDIHAAMVGWTPTGAYEPMEFQESDVEEIGDGLIVGFVNYQTARLI